MGGIAGVPLPSRDAARTCRTNSKNNCLERLVEPSIHLHDPLTWLIERHTGCSLALTMWRGCLLPLVLLCHLPPTSAFFERRNERRFPMMPRWDMPFGLGKIAPSRQDEDSIDSDGGHENPRRNLILGSAAALGSAILGSQGRPAKASTVVLEESEARRIDIFERNAPSVVFIDTFTEKKDQFSPNAMEVPLGSGSGFVWDKEGHIGKTFRASSTDRSDVK